ncbi:RDD family protein [Halobacillus faecis]
MENPAGFWNRVGARFVDGFILAGVFGVLTGEFVQDDFTVVDVLAIFYALLLPPIWYGYTLGRKALGNRIVKTDGSDVTFINIVLRELVGGLVYVVTLGIAFIVSAFMVGLREDKRGIHDFIGGTYVTKDAPKDRDRSEYDKIHAST